MTLRDGVSASLKTYVPGSQRHARHFHGVAERQERPLQRVHTPGRWPAGQHREDRQRQHGRN